LGVSSAELDALVRAARGAGALGAKLTGAGGGGAVIALAPDRAEEVLKSWRAMGCYGFLTQVGK
jgi:mevalonate kinase